MCVCSNLRPNRFFLTKVWKLLDIGLVVFFHDYKYHRKPVPYMTYSTKPSFCQFRLVYISSSQALAGEHVGVLVEYSVKQMERFL